MYNQVSHRASVHTAMLATHNVIGAPEVRGKLTAVSSLPTRRHAGSSSRCQRRRVRTQTRLNAQEDSSTPSRIFDAEDFAKPARPLEKGVDFDEEYTPAGYVYEAVPVTKAGRERMKGEPQWVRVRPKVGEVGKRKSDSFVVEKTLSEHSRILELTLDRPLGMVFEEDSQGRVRVSELVAGKQAEQAAAVAKLTQKIDSVALPGDVLRAFTATILQYPPKASITGDLTGTIRKVVLYGADAQPWRKTSEALRIGRVADGPVTLVLERAEAGSPLSFWEPEEQKEDPSEEEGEVRAGASKQNEEKARIKLDPMLNEAEFDRDSQDVGKAVLGTLGIFALLVLAGFS
mmetsp:Transcript_13349/g.18237  ORF Transcript_13349/g.18237 Transcript_13349/m.18237 type:complete len:345 (+) Transcript_13349:167-1201(+)|eukprot:CAMPEP_0196581016 /NCGR_PEP_ID=MMETSP1081-20130531/31971_1 /TAXON_ID=36882 /ORGANISM="Pyramimonas amylifera, Strain CCMP720" /LENGTH=344 /DNA_ID=CAMNT_0041901093 /DNA_START=163 /DNA_END=1197 /DNA_ORIENTATION=-